jgi:hypothetical protein
MGEEPSGRRARGDVSAAAVSMRARFERFPATVKGAFVIRGEDSDPHQVVVRGGRVIRLPSSQAREVPLEPVTVDCPPHHDVFVPFEMPIGDLDPGWYGFEVELDVDGSPRKFRGDRRFVVGWPRGTIRTGTVRVDRELKVGDTVVRVDRVQLTTDSVSVRFTVQPPQPVTMRAEAGRSRLDVLAVEVNPQTGEGIATAYPAPRPEPSLRLEFEGEGRARADLSVELP